MSAATIARPAPRTCRGATPSALPGFQPWSQWQASTTVHARMQGNVEAGSIAFLGDSITSSLDVTRVSPFGLNFGIPGDTIAGLLNRIGGLSSLERSGGVSLMIGVNDMITFTPGVTVKAQLAQLLGWLKGPLVLTKLVHIDWANPIFSRPDGLQQYLNMNLAIINDHLGVLCAERPETVLIDLNPVLTGADGRLRPEFHIGDGIHLSTAAYEVWIAALRDAFGQLLGPMAIAPAA